MPYTYEDLQYFVPVAYPTEQWCYGYKKFLRHCGNEHFNKMKAIFRKTLSKELSEQVIANITRERDNFRYSYLDSWFIHFYLRYLPWHRWYSPESPPYNPLLLHDRFHKKGK